ncbi:MAG TPA: sigma factor-like helix-turn-helix DNA-binding protein [Nakamurella sp.]
MLPPGALSPPSQLAPTLRAVGGLSTAQVAAAFLVHETTMAQRISRAKQRIRDAGAPNSSCPPPANMPVGSPSCCMCGI